MEFRWEKSLKVNARQYPSGGNVSNVSCQRNVVLRPTWQFLPNPQTDSQSSNTQSIKIEMKLFNNLPKSPRIPGYNIPMCFPFQRETKHPIFYTASEKSNRSSRFSAAPRRCRTCSLAQTSRPRCLPAAAGNIRPRRSPPGAMEEWWLCSRCDAWANKTGMNVHQV